MFKIEVVGETPPRCDEEVGVVFKEENERGNDIKWVLTEGV